MTKIEWTDETWNPVTGCTKVSQGCKNCYAERTATRLAGRVGYPPAPHQFDVTLHHDRLNIPLRWRKPRRIFVNSMSDLFHPNVPCGFIDAVLEVIAACPQHTFQVLTKRPELIEEKLYRFCKENPARELGGGDYLPNLQIGVSVENQETANERIPWLLKTLAAVRFVSYEPALGPVDFFKANGNVSGVNAAPKFSWIANTGIDWVIAGCESGLGARPAQDDWFRSVRDQCLSANVPFFLKQMQGFNGAIVKMPELDGQVWAQYPT
jgi:protein gp37